ncbi:unnamed protein product [Chrysoparadoxa australica]
MAKRPPANIELVEGYYLDNFEKLLSFIEEVYFDILQKEELEFLKVFKSCSIDARRLFVRLALRRKSFFRLSKLNYAEIDIEKALEECDAVGLFELNPEVEFPDIFEPFTVSEIKAFYKHCGGKKPPSKRDDLLEVCEEFEEHIYDWITSEDTLIWPLFSETVEKFQLLFFGNLYQDMAQFILEDLGIKKYEKIKIDKDTRYFSGRDHLDAHYEWSYLHGLLWEAGEGRDLDAAETILKELKKIKYKGDSLKRRLSRSYNLVAKLYESEGELDKALKLYEKSIKEPARERKIRILEKQGKDKKALKLCEELLENPFSESEVYFSRFFREKLKKKLGLEYEKRKKLPTPAEEVLPIKWDKQGRVESQVLEYLKEKGFHGFFSENNYFGTLSALLFWDEFWAPAPGVFYHPFEQAPRDFFSGEFYQRQKKAIEKKSEWWLEQKDWWKVLEPLYEEKFLTFCSLTNWKRADKDNLKTLVEAMNYEMLIDIANQQLKDPKQYRSGFPDLFLVNDRGEFHLGEVKSPNDQVQTSQKRWFDFFTERNIPFKIYRLKN